MLQTAFPDPLILTTVLAYMGLAAGLGLAAVSLLLLLRTRRKGTGAVYLALSGFLGFTLVRVLLRAAEGAVCYRPPLMTLLLYGGLIVLVLYFMLDGWRVLRAECARSRPKEGGGGS